MSLIGDALQPIVNGLVCRALEPGTALDSGFFGVYDFSGNRLPAPEKEAERNGLRNALNCPNPSPYDGQYFPEGTDGSGQCAVKYRVEAPYTYKDQQGQTQNETAIGGNIQGPLGNVGFDVYYTPNLSGLRFWVGTPQGKVYFGERGGYGYDELRLGVVSKQREDGGLDNCGNADTRPRFVGAVPIGVTNNTVIYGPGSIVLDPARKGPGGGLTIPFGVLAPTGIINGRLNVGVEPKIEIEPEFEYSPEGQAPSDEPAPEGVEPPPPGDENDPPEDEEGRCMAGVVVYTTKQTPLKQTGEFGSGQAFPRVYAPKSGLVSFAVKIGDLRTWSEPIPVKAHTQLIEAPKIGCSYYVGVRSEVGFIHVLRAIYVDTKETKE